MHTFSALYKFSGALKELMSIYVTTNMIPQHCDITSCYQFLQVTINDGGIPEPLTSTVQVIVTISDENDNRPQWQNKVGSLQVSLLK